MVAGVFDFKEQDEGGGSCFKMQVKLNYDHNHEMTSCDAWNFLEVYQDTKWRYFEHLGTSSRAHLSSTKAAAQCHDVPGLKCSVESSEHCSNVEREVFHDEMTQEC